MVEGGLEREALQEESTAFLKAALWYRGSAQKRLPSTPVTRLRSTRANFPWTAASRSF